VYVLYHRPDVHDESMRINLGGIGMSFGRDQV
jgi:hypothetical protein